MFTALLLLACHPGPETAADCIPTTGDNCSCERQCLTEHELKVAQRNGVCDLGCMFGEDTASMSMEPNWECEVRDGECAVVEE